MKKNWIYSITACALAAAFLTGCGDGSFSLELGKAGTNQATTLPAEELASDTELAILNYEYQYNSGEFSAEDYRALADLYKEQGLIRKQRDMLEQSWRLYGDQQAFETLQAIAVNLAEEDPAVLEAAQTMLQNLEVADYLGEGIHMIESEEWFDIMMPKLGEGVRNYFLLQGGQKALTIQAGYDEKGIPFSSVWNYKNDRVTLLKCSGSTVQVLDTGLTEVGYNGDFTLWTLDGASGSIRQEEGTLANGIYTGAYRTRLHIGSEGGDLYDLWSNRDNMDYEAYAGDFDESGYTTLEQPSAAKRTSLADGSGYHTCVVYAYNEGKTGCLYAGLENGEEEYAFSVMAMGVSPEPNISVYEPAEQRDGGVNKESGETDAAPQVRIFDGEIQYLSGNTWVTLGSVY